MAESIAIKNEGGAVTDETLAALDNALVNELPFHIVDDSPEREPETTEPVEPERAEEVEPEQAEVEEEPAEEEQSEIDYDYSAEIPIPNEEPIKLGDLKDYYVKQTAREVEMQNREAEIATEYGRLAQLNQELTATGKPLTEEQRRVVETMQQQRLQRESDLMMRAIPEWQDNATLQKDRADIVRILKPYGITEEMINGVADHRIALLYKHHLELVRRVERVAEVKPKEAQPLKAPPGRRPSKPQGGRKAATDKLVQRALASDSNQDKLAAIDALIGE